MPCRFRPLRYSFGEWLHLELVIMSDEARLCTVPPMGGTDWAVRCGHQRIACIGCQSVRLVRGSRPLGSLLFRTLRLFTCKVPVNRGACGCPALFAATAMERPSSDACAPRYHVIHVSKRLHIACARLPLRCPYLTAVCGQRRRQQQQGPTRPQRGRTGRRRRPGHRASAGGAHPAHGPGSAVGNRLSSVGGGRGNHRQSMCTAVAACLGGTPLPLLH